MLNVVGLDGKRNERTKYLSGGMKRRREIARGLMTSPRVLFLDEPTLGLDPQTRMKMWEYIREVNRKGTTIFLTTHYMDEADRLSNRISIIDHGRIIVSGTPEELKSTLGEDVIYLETGDNPAAEEAIRTLPGITSIKNSYRGLAVILNQDSSRCLPAIIERVRRKNIAIWNVSLKKPTMDDVFIHYTGRELRDAGSEKAMARGKG